MLILFRLPIVQSESTNDPDLGPKGKDKVTVDSPIPAYGMYILTVPWHITYHT